MRQTERVTWTRRDVLVGAAALVVAPRARPRAQPRPRPRAAAEGAVPTDPFPWGVASGDPDATSVVVWTRVSPPAGSEGAVVLTWELAADERFEERTASGDVEVTAADGYTAHVVAPVDGARWYRFRLGEAVSPAGRCAPLPTGEVHTWKIATASCQHYETGYYASYRDLVEWGPDAVVFLGDFIYEGAARPVGGEVLRSHDGPEPVDLDGYRGRYAQYLSDPQLQAARAACPWFVIWDDHEVENNYAGLVPQDPAESAAFPARRAAAYQAWWEHTPTRIARPAEGTPTILSRHVGVGDLVDLLLLDGRQFRDDQACGDVALSFDPPCPEVADPARTMLGAEQEAWLANRFAAASARWTVLGQQTVLTDITLPDSGVVLNYDQWDGYPAARQRLLEAASATERLVVLTGDIHLAGVGRLPGVGVEFVTTSISSTGNIDPAATDAVRPLLPAIVDIELAHRGYTRHTITPDRWTAEYRAVDDVAAADSPVSTWRTFTIDPDTRDAVAAG